MSPKAMTSSGGHLGLAPMAAHRADVMSARRREARLSPRPWLDPVDPEVRQASRSAGPVG
jgi:uncharacterized lipoprotein YddW (UPF0748 family)